MLLDIRLYEMSQKYFMGGNGGLTGGRYCPLFTSQLMPNCFTSSVGMYMLSSVRCLAIKSKIRKAIYFGTELIASHDVYRSNLHEP